LKEFQLEIEWNLYQKKSYSFSVDYLSGLILDFKTLYMVIEGSFDIMIFPEIIHNVFKISRCKLKTYPEINKNMYLNAIAILQKRESDIRKKNKNKIHIEEGIDVTKNCKYILKEKNIIDIIELGYYLHAHGNILYENGEEIQLIPFVKDIGLFVGEDIKNIHQRINEVKSRSKPYKFLDFLIKNY